MSLYVPVRAFAALKETLADFYGSPPPDEMLEKWWESKFLPAYAESNEWSAIKTAPKTGQSFLAYDPDLYGKCIAAWVNGGWCVAMGSGQYGLAYEERPFTHWRTLPLHPALKAAPGGLRE